MQQQHTIAATTIYQSSPNLNQKYHARTQHCSNKYNMICKKIGLIYMEEWICMDRERCMEERIYWYCKLRGATIVLIPSYGSSATCEEGVLSRNDQRYERWYQSIHRGETYRTIVCSVVQIPQWYHDVIEGSDGVSPAFNVESTVY